MYDVPFKVVGQNNETKEITVTVLEGLSTGFTIIAQRYDPDNPLHVIPDVEKENPPLFVIQSGVAAIYWYYFMPEETKNDLRDFIEYEISKRYP